MCQKVNWLLKNTAFFPPFLELTKKSWRFQSSLKKGVNKAGYNFGNGNVRPTTPNAFHWKLPLFFNRSKSNPPLEFRKFYTAYVKSTWENSSRYVWKGIFMESSRNFTVKFFACFCVVDVVLHAPFAHWSFLVRVLIAGIKSLSTTFRCSNEKTFGFLASKKTFSLK